VALVEDIMNHSGKVKKEVKRKPQKKERITNWRMSIIAELHDIKRLAKGLQKCVEIPKFRGQYTKPNAKKSSFPGLEMTLKFSKPMSETGIRKIVTEFITPNDLFIVNPLKDKEEIEASLETHKDISRRLENTEKLKKGDSFEYKNSTKPNTLDDAQKLIREKGKRLAAEDWADQNFSPETFLKAKRKDRWIKDVEEARERRIKAHKLVSTFYPWQQYLKEELEKPPNDRTIWVVLDERGCSGKSYFQRVIGDLYGDNVLMLTSSSNKDMFHTVAKNPDCKIVIMNVARQSKTLNLEALKYITDGIVQSIKYSRRYRRINHPHVVLLCNNPLEWGGLTEDRWKILYIKTGQEIENKIDSYEVLSLSQYLYSFAQKQ
jgi:hypothetical protein